MRPAHTALPGMTLPDLAGCSAIGSGAGAVVGIAAGANPIVGTAIGLGTKAAVGALVACLARMQQNGQQDAVAGSLPVGGAAEWRITHTQPPGNTHGTLPLASLVPDPLADCRLPRDRLHRRRQQTCRRPRYQRLHGARRWQ